MPEPVRGSTHFYKFGLALISHGRCVLRYDNEAGKGDHRHIGNDETSITFIDMDDLIAMFATDVEGWLNANPQG